jgi:hypothetical protein
MPKKAGDKSGTSTLTQSAERPPIAYVDDEPSTVLGSTITSRHCWRNCLSGTPIDQSTDQLAFIARAKVMPGDGMLEPSYISIQGRGLVRLAITS